MRREDWAGRLDESVRLARARDFAWGRFDCCLFACDCIEAMTGVDPGVEFRERYRNRAGARRALGQGGLASTVERLAARHGYREIAPARAGRGDLVLLEGCEAGPDGLGICVGAAALAMTPAGLRAVARPFWRRAWSI